MPRTPITGPETLLFLSKTRGRSSITKLNAFPGAKILVIHFSVSDIGSVVLLVLKHLSVRIREMK